MSEGFLLPDRAGGVLELVCGSCGRSFKRLKNCGKTVYPAIVVAKRSEKKVNMFGHHDCSVETKPIVIAT
jgi:hypothetical protein